MYVPIVLKCLLFFVGFVASKNERNRGVIAKAKCQQFRIFPDLSRFTFDLGGGTPVIFGDFPYVAALGWKVEGNRTYDFRCGASVISYEYLLTAAHCVTTTMKPTIIRIGAYDLYDPIEDPVDIEIQNIIVHPNPLKNDLALVQLKKPFNDSVLPVCLYTDPDDPEPKVDLKSAGWGYTDPNPDRETHPYILNKGVVNLWPKDNCTRAIQAAGERLRSRLDGKLCALKTNSTGHTVVDACEGDSGGPLQLEVNHRRYLVGVVSMGKQCFTHGKPGFYTRVSSYIDWIEKNVWPDEWKAAENN